MAKTERLQIRIDDETKAKATELFDGLGITITDAVTQFIHQSLASGGRAVTVDLSPRNSKNSVKQPHRQ